MVCLSAAAVADPPPKAPASTFAARRAVLRAGLDEELALVPGDVASKGPFRQDNDFYYLTGGDWADSVLALTRDGAWLFQGKTPDPLEPVAFFHREPSGFTAVLPADKLGVVIDQYEKDGVLVAGQTEEYYSTANRPGEAGSMDRPFERSARRLGFLKKLKAAHPEGKFKALEGRLAALRMIKDDGEVDLLRRAAEVTGKSLMAAMAKAEPGMAEREFQRMVEQGYLERGSDWLAFPTIVGSGAHSTVVHYTKNSDVFPESGLVVCDTGAEVGNYASDVTRTFPVDGKFTKRQREVYEAVLAAQEAGCEAVKPGMTLVEIHVIAQAVLKKRGFPGPMPHYTCHWVGLAVHDPGDYGAKLKPGMVLTVEPGLYLKEEGLGVRIEDVLLVTEDGAENLTAWIPKSVEALEKLVGSEAR